MSPLAAALEHYRAQVRPRAALLDRDPAALAGALAGLGRAGLLGLKVPAERGGGGLSPREFRGVQEAAARASGALAFLQTQHQSACAFVAEADNPAAARWLAPLARGEVTAGVAFSHLRRPGAPALRAAPIPGGYALRGEAPWVTGWGLLDRCATAATLPDGRVLFCLHPLAGAPALVASPPLALVACEVAQTVALRFEGLRVPEEDALSIRPGDWITRRDAASAAGRAAFALGCTGAAADVVAGRDPGAAAALEAALDAARAEVEAAIEGGDPDRQLAARVAAIALMGRAAHAAVAACAGASNLAGHPAGRVYREALLFTVLSQSAPVRAATVSALAGSPLG
jgi:alkylation response protein AidB-like acyl-CoA dehydrogenase